MSDEIARARLTATGRPGPGNRASTRITRLTWFLTTVAIAAVGCQGTDGPILRSLSSDTSVGGFGGATGAAGQAGASAVSPPAPMVSWQIQLSGTVDTSVDAELYIIDFEAPEQVFDELEAAGRTVICFFSAGSLEPWRSDTDALPASAVGEPMQAYPDELWLDIRDPTVVAVMTDRIRSAATRGCAGVLPANSDGFLNATGFPLTLDDQLEFNRQLSATAHQAGLSAGFAGGAAVLVEVLVDDYDWGFAVDCVATDCSHVASFLAAGRPVFVVEYGDPGQADTICARAADLGLNAIFKNPDLDAERVACP